MRLIGVMATLFVLIISGGAFADGCYVPALDLSAKSHAKDIYEPSQKAIVYHHDGRESLIVQVSYKGEASGFCWLVPTPAKPEISIVNAPLFHLLHNATAPKLRYWLDADKQLAELYHVRSRPSAKLQVEVIEQKQVGEYYVSVLDADNAVSLARWLNDNGYRVTSRYTRVFDYYLKRGWVFTAAKITNPNSGKASSQLREGTLAPLRLDFDSQEPIYPLKISSLNPGTTKLLLYTMTRHRMECVGLKTECAIDFERGLGDRRQQMLEVSFAMEELLREQWSYNMILTKLSGDFSPERITQDLVFTQAYDDKNIEPEFASPGIMRNMAAVLVFGLVMMLFFPYNIITCCLLLLASRKMDFGQLKILLYCSVAFLLFGRSLELIVTVILASCLIIWQYIVRRKKNSSWIIND